MSADKKTILNAVHREMGARMVPFGGWDMPVNYGSQIDYHHPLRNDASLFSVFLFSVFALYFSRFR